MYLFLKQRITVSFQEHIFHNLWLILLILGFIGFSGKGPRNKNLSVLAVAKCFDQLNDSQGRLAPCKPGILNQEAFMKACKPQLPFALQVKILTIQKSPIFICTKDKITIFPPKRWHYAPKIMLQPLRLHLF